MPEGIGHLFGYTACFQCFLPEILPEIGSVEGCAGLGGDKRNAGASCLEDNGRQCSFYNL